MHKVKIYFFSLLQKNKKNLGKTETILLNFTKNNRIILSPYMYAIVHQFH